MKKFLFCAFALVFMTALTSFSKNGNPDKLDNAIFSWAETSFDFGKIKVNVPVTHEFTFVNKGTEPLVITSVQASCGCTVAEYSKEPIAPGQRGFVKATYNAAKVGAFTKTVTINANTDDNAFQLTIKGEVVAH